MDTHFRERERCVPIWLTVDPETRAQIFAAIAGLTALLDQIEGTSNSPERSSWQHHYDTLNGRNAK